MTATTEAPAAGNAAKGEGKAAKAAGKGATDATKLAAQAAAEGRASANISVADLARSFGTRKAAAMTAASEGGQAEGTEGGPAAEDGGESEAEGGGQAHDATGTEGADTEQSGAEGTEAAEEDQDQEQDQDQEEGEGEEAAETQGATVPVKAHRKALKRIDSLTKRLRTVEEALARGGEEGAAKGGAPATRAGADPFSNHPVIAEINANLTVVNHALRFADENPDGGEYTDEKGGKREFTAAEVRTIRRNAEASRTELLTERAATLQSLRSAHQAEATKADKEFAAAYPKLTKRDTAEGIEFEETVRQAPELKRFPDYKLWIADAMAGRAARLAKAKAGANSGKNGQAVRPLGAPMVKPKGSNEPPNVVTQAAAGAPRVNAKQKDAQVARETFQKSGRVEDLAVMFSRNKAARQAA